MSSEPKLTTWPGVGLVAANMIGAGVLLSAGFMAQEMGPGSILAAWIVGAGLALAGARAYAELARLVPRSGGEYRYVSELLHPALGFLAGWASLLVGFSAPIALDALAAGAFARTVFPSLSPPWTGAAFVLVLTGLHAAGQRVSARAQNTLVLLKALLLAGVVAVGLALGQTAWPSWSPPAAHPGAGFPVAAFARSLFFIAFAFSGWNAVAYASEEFREPARTVPRAMLLGCLLVAGLYLLVNFIFVANLTPADAAVVFDYETRQVTLAHALVSRLIGPRAGAVMSLATVAILLSATSAMLYVGPRVYAAMARDGYLPRALASREGRPPALSVILQGALAIAILFTHRLQTILGNVGAILTFFAALAALGLFRAALRRDGGPRPRLAGLCAAGVYVAGSVALLAFDVWRHADSVPWMGVVIAAGLCAYAFARGRASAEPRAPEAARSPAPPPFASLYRSRGSARRRAAYVTASLLAQGGLIVAVVLLEKPRDRLVDVQILTPVSFRRAGLPAPPGPPPARAAPQPRPKVPRPAVKPLVSPREIPEQPPAPDPTPPEAEEEAGGEGGVVGGVPGGSADGVVGGAPGGEGAAGGSTAAEPVAARPADVAMVRERIARTLAYPPRAKKMGWEGHVALAFILLADGRVRDLLVAQTSGYPLLDDAALSAVQRATPFPPPGVTVRIEVPVTFRLR